MQQHIRSSWFCPRRLTGSALLAAWLLLCFDAPFVFAQSLPPTPEPSAQLSNQAELPVPPFVPGQVLVGVDASAPAAASAEPIWAGLPVTGVVPLDLRSAPVAAAGTLPLAGFQLTVPAGEEWAVIEALQARSNVVFAEPNWLARTAQTEVDAQPEVPVVATPESPFRISDTLYRDQWYLQRIGMSRAWETALGEGGAGFNEVVVAVLDTGVDFTHPDLANRLLPGRNYLFAGATPQDDNGHGTHIAGLIAAGTNNGGIAGAGWDARILPMKVLDGSGIGSVPPIAQAIRDAADGGVEIINLSLEIAVSSDVLRLAVEYAQAQGSLVIAAAGNCGFGTVCPPPVRYPAAYPSVIAVAATTYYDGIAYYSAAGPQLDIAAPGGGAGQSIFSTWSSSAVSRCRNGLRQIDGGYYCTVDGTSMAAGIVSGVAALIWSVRPELTADQVRAVLLETSAAVAAGGRDQVGTGRLDAERAVRLALRPRLYFDTSQVQVSSPAGGEAITRTITFYNPSLERLTWVMTPTSTTDWYAVVGPVSGTIHYGAPVTTQIVITPTQQGLGSHLGEYRVIATRKDGGRTIYPVGLTLEVMTQTAGGRVFFPLVIGNPPTLSWAQPDAAGRTAYTIFDHSSLTMQLPFPITLAGRVYTNTRIYDDGFLVLAESASPVALPTHCLANQVWPSLTVYGWWSDLLPQPMVSRLSTFTPDPGRFVIEYENFVPAALPDHTVTFQIVLYMTGQIDFNYWSLPEAVPGDVTVGVAATEGRFYNQVACRQGSSRLGVLPQAHQTLSFKPEDLY
jgi:subtilisin family serine protease